jgi:hypothetical protein
MKSRRMECNCKALFRSKVRLNFLTTILDVPNVDEFVFRTSSDELLTNAYVKTSNFLSVEGCDQVLKSKFFWLLSLKICDFKFGVDNLSLLGNGKNLIFLRRNNETLNVVISISRESFFSCHFDFATVSNLISWNSFII